MPLLLVLTVFIFLLFYLHQKVQIYSTAFQLSRNYRNYQEFASQKDYLRYNFSKRTSLVYLSDWVSEQNFTAPEKERLLAFRPSGAEPEVAERELLFGRFHIPAFISEVFARER